MIFIIIMCQKLENHTLFFGSTISFQHLTPPMPVPSLDEKGRGLHVKLSANVDF